MTTHDVRNNVHCCNDKMFSNVLFGDSLPRQSCLSNFASA